MWLWLKLGDTKEYDVKFGSWQIYKHIYKENIAIDYNDDINNKSYKRKYVEKEFVYLNKKSMIMRFSGETDFNFNPNGKVFGYGRSHYHHYEKLLREDNSKGFTSEELIEKLKTCKDRYHSQPNISLMPQTGNLQSVKKGVGNDRLDVFVLCIDSYYKKNFNALLNHCSHENRKYLQSFLDLFKSANEYCNVIHHIDQKLTEDLIESGRKPIDSADRIIEYMDLFDRFWNQKKKYIDECILKQ